MGSTERPLRARRLWTAVRLLLAVQRRAGFLHVYAAVTILTILIVRIALPEEWHPWAVPVLLLGEYGTMGVFMTGAHRYLERIEGSDVALVVTPLESREHVAAMILAPALVATAAGAILHAGVLGLDGRTALLLLPLWLTALLAGATGIVLASYHGEFTRFLVASIPVIAVFSLPYLSLFGATHRLAFAWLPWDAALFSYANLARPEPAQLVYVLLTAELAVFAALGFAWAERRCARRLHGVGRSA